MNDKQLKIKELREESGHLFIDCKRALDKCDWDMKSALEYLSKYESPHISRIYD